MTIAPARRRVVWGSVVAASAIVLVIAALVAVHIVIWRHDNVYQRDIVAENASGVVRTLTITDAAGKTIDEVKIVPGESRSVAVPRTKVKVDFELCGTEGDFRTRAGGGFVKIEVKPAHCYVTDHQGTP